MGLSFGEVRTWDVDAIETALRSHKSRVDELTDLEEDLRKTGSWERVGVQGGPTRPRPR